MPVDHALTVTRPGAVRHPVFARHGQSAGIVLVFLSAFFWSLGGAIARFVEAGDIWTVVFWRSLWAASFLLAFMLWRDGLRGTSMLFRGMGWPGLGVALCFATASVTFVVALTYTTVANVMLINAGVPLLAALMGWMLFREAVSPATWLAIAAVIAGVVVMVSDSFGGAVSPVGQALACLIAIAFATATVITRRFSHVRMTPATCLGTVLACGLAATQAGAFAVSARDMAFLFAFGALNLGLGLALFATGARLVPAAVAALLGTFETLLGPLWVFLVHGEVPSARTVVGGAIVFAALLAHIAMQFLRGPVAARPGTTGVPLPE